MTQSCHIRLIRFQAEQESLFGENQIGRGHEANRRRSTTSAVRATQSLAARLASDHGTGKVGR